MARPEAAAPARKAHTRGAGPDLRSALARIAQDCRLVHNDERPGAGAGADSLPITPRREAARIIAGWDGYRPTPLVGFPSTASALGLATLEVKVEDERFGIRTFKALGPPFAMARALARRLRASGRPADEAAVFAGRCAGMLSDVVVTAASSGNHGRALAWAAERAGCACVIFMAEHTGAERERNIAQHGAEVRRVPGSFDDALAAAVEASRQPGWLLVSELGSDDPDMPVDILLGYGVIGSEIADQTKARPPTHLFVSAGSGALAAGTAAAFEGRWDGAAPRLIVVEPTQADALRRSALAGLPVAAEGDLRTVMDGLAVRLPSPHAWPILREWADTFLAIPDEAALFALHLVARGRLGDAPLEIGETGIAALAAALVSAASPELRERLDLTAKSRVLAIACEGVTDRGEFERLLAEADRRFAGLAATAPAEGRG